MNDIISIAAMIFIALEMIFIIANIFIGYYRGLGRTVVRGVYLLVLGTISFFAGRSIAASLTKTVCDFVIPSLSGDVASLLESSPDIVILLENIIAALVAPIFFAVLFGLLQLLSLICFKRLSSYLVKTITGKTERSTVSKWTGAAAGLVLGIAIAAALLSPTYMALHIVENTPDDAFAILTESVEENGMTVGYEAPYSASAMRAPAVRPLSVGFAFRASSVSPINKWLISGLTSYSIPHALATEKDHESAINTLPVLIDTASDALFAYNTTAKSGGASIDAFTNAAAAVAPHLGESVAIKHLAADALHAVGVAFRDHGSFMSIELPKTDNAILTSIVNNLVDTLSKTTPESVADNMTSLFGKNAIKYGVELLPEDTSINKGLLSSMAKLDKDDPMKSLEDEALSGAVSEAIGNLADNDNMSGVLSDIKDFAVDIIKESDIDLSDEKYDSLYDEISQDLSNKISEKIDVETNERPSVSEVAKDLESTIEGYFDAYDVPVDSFQTSVIATCIAKEFYKEENIVDGNISITVDEVLDFFGITKDDVEDFLGGSSDSSDTPSIPEDFDPSDIPEDFDPSDIPEDFDITDIPEDFDISDYINQ